MFDHLFEKRIPDGFLDKHKGREFKDDEEIWILDSWNDFNVPYFRKKGGKTLYTCALWYSRLVKEAEKEKLTMVQTIIAGESENAR